MLVSCLDLDLGLLLLSFAVCHFCPSSFLFQLLFALSFYGFTDISLNLVEKFTNKEKKSGSRMVSY